MRIKNPFTVPTTEKVTEKHLYRVLISSVCSILLCMSCLAGTTWAWFTVSVENTGNVIQIATVSHTVTVTPTGEGAEALTPEGGVYQLAPGTYTLHLGVENDAAGDSFGKNPGPVYVLLSVGQGSGEYYYFPFGGSAGEAGYALTVYEAAAVNFSVSWVAPASAVPVSGDALTLGTAPVQAEPGSTTLPPTEAPAPSETKTSIEEST